MPLPPAILITRPEPQAGRLAALLRAEWGTRVNICLSPLMRTEFLSLNLPDGPFATLLLTSEAGAEAAGRLLAAGTTLPPDCACVGHRTAGAARALGFRVIAEYPTASALLAALLANPVGPCLYMHGRDVTLPLDQMLTKAGVAARGAVAYVQHEVPLAPEAIRVLKAGPAVVPLYSARSARLFLMAVPAAAMSMVYPCALSGAVAQALPADLAERALIAETPDGAGMLTAIRRAIMGLSP